MASRLLGLLTATLSVALACAPRAVGPGFVAGKCVETPMVSGLGRSSGNLAVRPAPVLHAGSAPKFLWFVRSHQGPLRLVIERLDGDGVASVVSINAVRGAATDLPAEWDGAASYSSNLTFDTPGCWRIRDADGSADDAIVVSVGPSR